MIDYIKSLLRKKKKVNYWDVRIESVDSLAISAFNHNLKSSNSSLTKGISLRLFNDNKIGFASTTYNQLDKKLCNKLVTDAINMSKFSQKSQLSIPKLVKDSKKIKQKINTDNISFKDKKDYIVNLSKNDNKNIKSKITVYSQVKKNKEFYNSIGSEIKQELNYVYGGASITSFKNNRFETYSDRTGEQGGYEVVKDLDNNVKNAQQNALELLKAKMAKGGKHNVIFDGALSDVFIHEALGHACESDIVIQGESILKDKLNTKISNDLINVYDDSTLKNEWGSFFYDDEGVKASKTRLLNKGKLVNYMSSLETSKMLGLKPSGNARAQSFSSIPIVRMSNTYIEKGKTSFDDMLKDLKNGVYLRGSRGGQVDTFKGNFQFSAMDGYLVKNGELSQRLTNVSLGGLTLETLNNIRSIEDKYNRGFPGFCGKGGQSVPVIGHCPSLLVDNVLIGGN